MALWLRSTTAQETKLELNRVRRVFRTGQQEIVAIESLDLSIARGELLCIVGPSGCGKSTLLNLLAGLDKPSSGSIRMDEHEIHGIGTDRSLLFQELGLFPWLTVRQNVEFGLRMQRVPRAQRRQKAWELLKLVRLEGFAEHFIHQLSGGMKQRVALARSLAVEPEILLMDEPFAALDAQTRDNLHDELERLWQETGKTIVFITHNVREAVRLGDRVIVLTPRPGRIRREFLVELPRPRHMEDARVASLAGEVLRSLRGEEVVA
jgi:NitT/TauT family transport system ATP-binding protein